MAYCRCCGVYADLDPAAMCDNCRDNWQPVGDRPRDLGYHGTGQPQPLGGDARCPSPQLQEGTTSPT